jgi:hypothetical protein
MLIKSSRFLLYGSENMSKKKVSFGSAAWGSAENRVRRLLGLPPVSVQRHTLRSWAKTGLQRQVIGWLGLERANALPDGFPVDVFDCLDRWVQAKGGSMQIGTDGLKVPLLKLNRKSAVSLSSMWVAYVDFEHESANWKALEAAEEALEDALTRECGQALNIRILSKPARIEIDNPNPPMVTFKSQWADYLDGKVGSLRYSLGVESTPQGDQVVDNRLDNSNEYSCAWFGAAGSGKTQSMTAALLSVCATTSPEELAVIVIDPKGLDFPVDGIPHLACQVVTDGSRACEIVQEVANILAQRAKSKDRAASRRRILLMVDELGYLIQSGNAEIADNLTSIAAMGRAWGISLFIGSQRATNEFFPKSIHSNLPAKWVGRVKDSGEAVFASGQAGCDAHKLPGKGAAMLYEPTGIVRLQSAYIGDANKDNYPEIVGEFISDLQKKWAGKRPHWRLGDPDQSTADPGDNNDNSGTSGKPLQAMIEDAVRKVLTEMATIQPATEQPEAQESEPDQPEIDTAILDNLPNSVLTALEAAYNEAPESFSAKLIRRICQEATGKEINGTKAGKIRDAFMAVATSFA